MKKFARSLAVASAVGVTALTGTAANATGAEPAPTTATVAAATVESAPTYKKSANTVVSYGSMEACYLDVPWMWFSGYDMVENCHASGGTVISIWRYNTGWF